MTGKSRQKPVLIGAPYHAPSVRVGDKATCHFRDGDVVVTSWTAAPISWPRCRSVATRRGGPGLLVNDELARAVRCESSLSIQYWWGVNAVTVWRWRMALGIEQFNEGSGLLRRQINAALELAYVAKLCRRNT
jgi:hypothetical protein